MSSKRICRPWDKRGKAPPRKKTQGGTTDETPFVAVEKVKFWSDRFYLNATIFDEANAEEPDDAATPSCRCGANNPPPLFSRSKLVASLDLKAAIFGSFSLDPAALVKEFPSLFGADADIPTLVLHGKKGWSVEKLQKKERDEDDDDEPESAPLDEDSVAASSSDDTVEEDGCSIGTQEEDTVKTSKRFQNVSGFASPVEKGLPPPSVQFPETVHFAEITPSWLPPEHMPLSYSKAVDTDTGALQSCIIEKRVYKKGVHHPKYMILLERSGSIVVVVSTANLSVPLSNDASWVQRFPPASQSQQQGQAAPSSKSNDFGAVLANFLQCQMLATAPAQLTAHGFVQRYLQWKSLVDLERRFDYRAAQVHLIATVPGDQEGRHSILHQRYNNLQNSGSNNNDNNEAKAERFLYGPQRVADLLDRLALPTSLQTEDDRLIFQPTSFGGDWNLRNMSDLVRSYLALDDPTISSPRDHDILQRLDIVWPTDFFVRQSSQIAKGEVSSSSVAVAAASDFSLGFASFAESVREERVEPEKESGGFLFLSSESFNRIHWDCLARMVMFESSVPAQRTLILTPHFKSVARLFKGNDYRIRKDFGVPRCEEYFSWFLLTSACLSHGAQGRVPTSRAPGSDAMSYSNFELGVLFTSRLQQRDQKNRLYCWKPSQCCCAASSSVGNGRQHHQPQLIHLPSPYSFRATPYVPDEDDMEFCETPYFHEILRDNACVGQMLSTPYGSALAAQYARECEQGL